MTPPQTQGSLHWWEWIAPSVLIAALTYVMGWSYAATYFDAFGVGLVSLTSRTSSSSFTAST